MNMLRSFVGAAALVLASAAAHAGSVWNFTYSGGDVSASGSFTTIGDGTSPSTITSVTGTYSDDTITNGAIDGIVALGTDGGFNYDNLFGGTGLFSNAGLLFDVNGSQHVNIYSDLGGFFSAAYEPAGVLNQRVELSVTSAVPEAGSVAMLLAGLGTLGIASRRKRRA